jgi:hypothetical protein
MTEDQAKTKWCPMVRVLVTPDNSVWQSNILTNRGVIPASDNDTLCIASDCMVWQDTGLEKECNQSVRTGKCGLAGKP